MHGWKWLLSFTLRVYADSNRCSHLCQVAISSHPFVAISQYLPFFLPFHLKTFFLITLRCVHCILQIIPHHPILLYLFPTLLFSMMKNLVTLYKGLLKSPNWCLSLPLSLFSLSILVLRLGNCFQKRLWVSLSLQPRLQCYPSCMVQLGRFLIFLPLHLHPISIKQVTLKYFFLISPSVIELWRAFFFFFCLSERYIYTVN